MLRACGLSFSSQSQEITRVSSEENTGGAPGSSKVWCVKGGRVVRFVVVSVLPRAEKVRDASRVVIGRGTIACLMPGVYSLLTINPQTKYLLSLSLSRSLVSDINDSVNTFAPLQFPRQVSSALDYIQLVAKEAQELADRSSVPGFSELAKAVLGLLCLAAERKESVAEAKYTACWCGDLLCLLSKADNVLGKVRPKEAEMADDVCVPDNVVLHLEA